MVNTDGNLVGINTMNLSLGGGSDGIGLAVPSNLVRNITEQIIKYGRVVRGYVGMSAYNTPSGVVISNVLKDGPADKSGLMPGDVIVSIDGITIDSIKQVVKIVASLEVDQKDTMEYRRDKELVESLIKVTAMPKSHKTINR